MKRNSNILSDICVIFGCNDDLELHDIGYYLM